MTCRCGRPDHPNLRGVPYDVKTMLRPCWLYENNEGYRRSVENLPPPDRPAERPWPLAVRLLAKMKAPEDRGLGDTVHRHLARLGGDFMSRLYKKLTGRDCGCGDRQAALNRLYPYATAGPPAPPP